MPDRVPAGAFCVSLMTFHETTKALISPLIILLAVTASFAGTPDVRDDRAVEVNVSGIGVIKGIVRDDVGSPIADATVAIFRVGTSQLLKQVRSAADGSYLARVLPGTYTVLAVAEGFNPVRLAEVEVDRSAQLTYGFKLQRAGSGNTLPEKRLDRNNPKWAIRSAQTSRSIYQHSDDSVEVAETAEADDGRDDQPRRAGQTVAETYLQGTATAHMPA